MAQAAFVALRRQVKALANTLLVLGGAVIGWSFYTGHFGGSFVNLLLFFIVIGLKLFTRLLRRRSTELFNRIDELATDGGPDAERALRQISVEMSKPSTERTMRLLRVAAWLGRLPLLRSSGSKIVRPPVSRLDSFVRFFFGDRTYKTVFQPARADIIFEWTEAEKLGERRRANYIKYVRCPWTMFGNLVAQAPVSLLRTVLEIVKRTIA